MSGGSLSMLLNSTQIAECLNNLYVQIVNYAAEIYLNLRTPSNSGVAYLCRNSFLDFANWKCNLLSKHRFFTLVRFKIVNRSIDYAYKTISNFLDSII